MSDKNKKIVPETKAEEIKETVAQEISEAVEKSEEIVVVSETQIAEKLKKPKKPKKPWTIKRVLGLVALALVALFVVNIIIGLIKGPDPIFVNTQMVKKIDLQQSLNTSGVINSSSVTTIFSPVSAPITEIHIKQGQIVQEGDLMFEFSTKDLERAYRQAASSAAIAGAQANQSNDASKENQDKTDNLPVRIDNIKIDIRNTEAIINSLKEQLTTKMTVLAATGKTEAEINEDPEIVALNAQIAAESAKLAQFQKTLAEYEALLEAAKKGVLDENGQTITNNQGVPAYVALETAKENLAAGKAGVSAPMAGVITSMTVVKGGLSQQYSVMCVIESIKDVDVIITLSRFDLENVKQGQKGTIETSGKEYAATITHIDSMATKGANGSYVMAKVTVDKPDADIRLGLDAKVKINTNLEKNVMAISISAISTDVSGVFCYVMVDGIAARRDLTLGISNDTMVVVISGLEVDELVILNTQDIYEGASVTNDPNYEKATSPITLVMG